MKQIAVVGRAMEKLLNAVEEAPTLATLRSRLEQREKEKAGLEAELARVVLTEREAPPLKVSREALRAMAARLKSALTPGDRETAREVLQGLVHRVTVRNDKARVE